MAGQILFAAGALMAVGLLAWWIIVRFAPARKKHNGRRY